MTTFEHHPLSDPRGHIRLLDLQPGDRGDLLKITLREVKLSENPSYEALSYTWGTESASHHISINGSHFAVRPNLFHCLNELRLSEAIQTLWIDAICIDQTNIPERNEQVKIMSKVYAQAALVRIWVGNPDSWTRDLFRYMNASKQERESLAWQSLDKEGILLGEGARATPVAQALLDICSREYWTRAWILQEVIVSGSKVLHCGSYSTRWSVFCATLNRISYSFTSSVLSRTRNTRVYLLSELPDSHTRKESTLEELLETFGEAACGDIRDRAYALSGLAKDCTPGHPFPINYAEDKCVLFFRTIIFCQPKDPFKFASHLLHILGIDTTSLQRYIQINDQEIISKQLKVELSAYYFGTASDISTSGTRGKGPSGWKDVRQEGMLKELVAQESPDGTSSPPPTDEIKIFQIEGSAIGFLMGSICDGVKGALVPVVVQQVVRDDDVDKAELVMYRSSSILRDVPIKSGRSLFGVNILLQPESFVWLLIESDKWGVVEQPWDRGRRREQREESVGSSSRLGGRVSD
ncbi:heterokaryon incompatibility protein-domain-containing protein [Halenospora varia]|nr:heterokaryon incompatibility protein-domain-containing protein [Halenospora varia]